MKIAVGLSGGVDSALAASLLKEQGHEVTGVFLECWNEPGCRTDQDRKDALGVALKLKIPFKVLDFKSAYKSKVLDWFYREYKAGWTPNPDILCNQEIKFGLFLNWALNNGFDSIATGHYCQLKSGRLYRSVDEAKDQTYFLALLKQKQLKHVLFPLGHLSKKQVRSEAKKRGLKVWNKKDSSGICFIGLSAARQGHDVKFKDFLQRKIKSHVGETVNLTGRIVGKHDGVEFYTIGQRWHRPYFVIQKDIKRNRLIVGKRQDLARKEFRVKNWSWIGKTTQPCPALKVRIRHQGRLIGCEIEKKKVNLSKTEYGIAPGQVAVIYDGVECLGGGVILG